ncbi:HAD family hydrolase [Peptococcus simiae]|uniref:HAD family hydrolase n=1 Tax=Peptococcus simiae TaxID=1643805 RepID=A0ABW9GZY1_9FIRM
MTALLIDCDGTLCDTLSIWTHLAEDDLIARGLKPEASLKEDIAPFSMAQAAYFICSRYGLGCGPEAVIAAWEDQLSHFYRAEAPAKAGARQFLERASQLGLPAYCVTLTPLSLVGPLLDRTGLAPLLAGIFSGHDLRLGKDSPALYSYAAKAAGRAPSQCLVIEDSLFALQVAMDAGFQGWAFIDDWHGPDQAEALKAQAQATLYRWPEAEALLTGLK